MIVSINQPAYLPWLGYFDRIDSSDLHIVLDHVQFEKNSFINRNKIKTKDGNIWLTVPIKTKGKFKNLSIKNLEINNDIKWKKKHLFSIKYYYARSLYFDHYYPTLEKIYNDDWNSLMDLIKNMNEYFFDCLDIKTPLIYSSSLKVKSTKSSLILELCKYTHATFYLSGDLGKHYLEEKKFEEKNIQIVYQNYKHPVYQQLYGEFIPYMSILDLLFNHGKNSLDIIKKGRSIKN